MKPMPVGVDIAKSIIQVHYVDEETGEVVNKAIKRAKFLEFFANRTPCLVGMEASGGSHHWARRLMAMGHEVKLMPGEFVKAFNIRNKNDMADAHAIWRAVQQPSKAVAVKTEMQQAMLALHRMRSQLMKFRLMQANALRGLLAEYGEVMGTGAASLAKAMPEILARLMERLPTVLIDSLREQFSEIDTVNQRIDALERRIRELSEIPGVGLLTATAAVASMGDASAFRSAREFAAWAGLAPRQVGSGGKINLHGISKRGDRYLRTLLVNGAHSVLLHAKKPSAWVTQLRERKPINVVAVALANKMARTIWAVLAHSRPYDIEHVRVKTA
ncbi:Mobile element protein [plant metagenome]|uniref:Mobile element protein n=1 Tax=plant metagenome TaxID=1297885 RepID=A0A484UNE1_9ZZZZ